MSNQALDLLIECELLKSNGNVIDISKVSSEELSRRFSHYVNARQHALNSEIDKYSPGSKLSAQFSTWSSKFSKGNTLSSLLVYDKVVLNDPLVSSADHISIEKLSQGLEFFSWLHPLIRNDLVSVYPIDFYDKPSNSVPLWSSEDAFRSSISPEIHDFAHSHAILKSVIPDDRGGMLILKENAHVKRRTALHVGFKDDVLYSGVGLFLHQTMENVRKGEGNTLLYDQTWDQNAVLAEEKFQRWAYQATNQAIIARLKAIYNQTTLAHSLGHTYITESSFESTLLSLSNSKSAEVISPCVRFFNVNEQFVSIESPNTIIELRDKYSHAFDRFNGSLISVSQELNGVSPEQFDRKCKALFHSEVMPQVDQVRSAIGQISSGLAKGTLASFCGIGLAISTGSVAPLMTSLLLSAAAGAVEAIPAVREYQLMRTRPAYVWHRLIR
ncbi:hypothetical protein [Pseudomonas orientalis]|uniref:hypothetical protein n=1 Tax=Pseudomonas orientalis TaxID=76758 RepID=UPI0012FFD88C|nr:hypothetical protein [Pseudomonas orientalis]